MPEPVCGLVYVSRWSGRRGMSGLYLSVLARVSSSWRQSLSRGCNSRKAWYMLRRRSRRGVVIVVDKNGEPQTMGIEVEWCVECGGVNEKIT